MLLSVSICPPYHRVLYRYGHYSGSTLTFKVHKVDSSIQGKDGLLHRTVDCVVMETTTKLTCFVHSKFIYLLVSNEIDGQSASVGCINVFIIRSMVIFLPYQKTRFLDVRPSETIKLAQVQIWA